MNQILKPKDELSDHEVPKVCSPEVDKNFF